MDIVFLEPENAQNVGSVCRAMKNFGFKNLVLVNPKCDHKSLDAIKLAKHAGDILKKAKIMKNIDEIIKKYDTLVATSAIVGSDFNIPRSPLKPEEFADLAKGKKSIALVLGRESEGMSNEEIISLYKKAFKNVDLRFKNLKESNIKSFISELIKNLRIFRNKITKYAYRNEEYSKCHY
ncbi:RNA methyltransferase [Candidatus Woesearchaeota archaeon]|nr:RNA methyltransferase [Candidatus Woesearchaeota archaeon]